MAQEHLIGKIVALDPEFIQKADKHFQMLNRPAVVISLNKKQKLALIVFADETQCEVKFDKLIMLKRQGDIAMKLNRNWNIPPDDFVKITKISKLMLSGLFADAIELALSSDMVRKYCTVNWGESYKNQQQKMSKRKM
ncbi:MAG: hypothetical protein BGO31_05565 [Bacteroidetes bacterium 43-16]|uniref:hypothetical protein n=1 Tax=uncultured Dysgonomonas sp. TaxID=206096 RepID=UPI000928D6E5|nr:hypothetical protein [uncultured Dysgonomonas sp.]OJV52299.1 MAG: hypothetical protein BGO31_05565 [Bacteroidetes bacterium 43-16]